MQLAKQRLQVLQEELSGIEETTDEMDDQIMTHVDALQDILNTTKKLVGDLLILGSLHETTTCRNSDFPLYRRRIY
jgi:hypothetical protein